MLEVGTNVVRLSSFGPLLWIIIKIFFTFFYKEGCIFQKIIQFTRIVGYTFIFLKIHLPAMYMLVFKFQNMEDMHQRCAYQNLKFYYLIKKNLQ
jgi:hypothetical protein